MSNRSAKFVAAIFAGILAGANLASVTDIHAQAATDNCLTAPKEKTPSGSHWYYKLERGTKRQCWYLRDENDKSARAAPLDSAADATAESTAADPAPPPRQAVRKSVANARAEYTAAQQRVEPDPIAPPPIKTSPAASELDATAPSSTVATRWPDASEVNPSGLIRTAAAEPPAAPPETIDAAPRTVPAPIPLAAADSSIARQSASMQMLLIVIAGALTLAGITASLLFRLGRRNRIRQFDRDRRAIWDSVESEYPPSAARSSRHGSLSSEARRSPSLLPDEEYPAQHFEEYPAQHFDEPIEDADDYRDASWEPRAVEDPERRVTEMLSRLARSAQN